MLELPVKKLLINFYSNCNLIFFSSNMFFSCWRKNEAWVIALLLVPDKRRQIFSTKIFKFSKAQEPITQGKRIILALSSATDKFGNLFFSPFLLQVKYDIVESKFSLVSPLDTGYFIHLLYFFITSV